MLYEGRRGDASSLTVIHTSDLHIAEYDDLKLSLDPAVEVADAVDADALLLVGDVFDSNRVPDGVVRATRDRLESLGRPVVALPGNHDPLVSDSCWDRGFRGSTRITVIGMTADHALAGQGRLLVWGVPHLGDSVRYEVPYPPVSESQWHIALLHGHFTDKSHERYSWPIRSVDLQRAGADYIALGHWDHRAQVAVKPPAWYSGAPHHVSGVNMVQLSEFAGVQVTTVDVPGNQAQITNRGR